MPLLEIPQSVLDWMEKGERGVSSEAIVAHLWKVPVRKWLGGDHPHDPDDLRRCLLLLSASPETAARIQEMSTRSAVWNRLTERWSELTTMFFEEAGENGLGRVGWEAPKTYRAMHAAIYGGSGDNGS